MNYLHALMRHIPPANCGFLPADRPVGLNPIRYAEENQKGMVVIDKLLEVSNGKLLIPVLCAFVGTFLVKGLFNLHRSKSADRRDFLDLWMRSEGRDDIWLEVSVRHLFGTYLPASIIRSLMQGPQAARALLEVSEFWDLLEINDETLELSWKKNSHATVSGRKVWRYALNALYFIAMGLALLCIYVAIVADAKTTTIVSLWIYGFFLGGFGMRCLHQADKVTTANSGAPRWLGLP